MKKKIEKKWNFDPTLCILGVENPNANPLDRKDALTGQPLDFEREEQTRKVETSKWLEHHFGSDSKSSTNSLIDEEEQPPKTSFFNVTIKSQPSRNAEPEYLQRNYSSSMRTSPRVYSPMEPERDANPRYFKGIGSSNLLFGLPHVRVAVRVLDTVWIPKIVSISTLASEKICHLGIWIVKQLKNTFKSLNFLLIFGALRVCDLTLLDFFEWGYAKDRTILKILSIRRPISVQYDRK